MTNPSISESMEYLGDRVKYHAYLSDRNNSSISFEAWRELRPFHQNPQTYTDLQKPIIGE